MNESDQNRPRAPRRKRGGAAAATASRVSPTRLRIMFRSRCLRRGIAGAGTCWCGSTDIPPKCCGSGPCCETLIEDWEIPVANRFWSPCWTTLDGLAADAFGGVALACCSTSRNGWRPRVSYAVILQVTQVIAIAPMLMIYLRSRPR